MKTTDDLRNIAGRDTDDFDIEWKLQVIERLDRIAEALQGFSSMIESCLNLDGDAIDVRVVKQ